MRSSTILASVPFLAGLATARDSAARDLDGSVWKNLSPATAKTISRNIGRDPVSSRAAADAFSPPSNLAAPLKEVWDHCESTYTQGLYGFKNYGWDQLKATEGHVVQP